VSGRYFGWRCRSATLNGEFAFAVEYVICWSCGIAWVDKPYTREEYQRHGLASAALRALRSEYPGLEWHTASEHLGDSKPFWAAVGSGVRANIDRVNSVSILISTKVRTERLVADHDMADGAVPRNARLWEVGDSAPKLSLLAFGRSSQVVTRRATREL